MGCNEAYLCIYADEVNVLQHSILNDFDSFEEKGNAKSQYYMVNKTKIRIKQTNQTKSRLTLS
jgi:hypothetical protein